MSQQFLDEMVVLAIAVFVGLAVIIDLWALWKGAPELTVSQSLRRVATRWPVLMWLHLALVGHLWFMATR